MKERANRLYELRKSRNLTQTAVAYRLNLSLSRISAYENGENIPCDVLRVFANFYSVSIDYILRFSDRTVGGSGVNLHISEQKLLDLYRNLPPDGKAVIDGMGPYQIMRIIACKHENAIYTALSQIIPFCDNKTVFRIIKRNFLFS